MILRQISIQAVYKHPNQFSFNVKSWCVQEQYWSYIKEYDTKKYQKIVIVVNNDLAFKKSDYQINESRADVLTINRYFDIVAFLKLDKVEQKKLLLDLLHDCMLYLSNCYDWKKEPLEYSFQCCIESNLEYKFNVKNKEYKSPNKDLIGYVKCYWDIDRFTANGIILRKNGIIIKQELLIDVEPYKAEFIYYSKCKWDNPYTFSLYSKDGQRWSIEILSIV